MVRGRKNPLWLGFARRFFDCRDALNWTQAMIAERSGLGQTSVSQWEDGRREPGIDAVEALAAAVGVPVCWLAFGQLGAEPFRGKRPTREPMAAIPTPQPGRYRNEDRAAQVGLRLAQLRADCGLSLRQLGESAGISHQVVTNIENGRGMPKLDTAERLAIALGVAPCLLAYGIEAPPRTSRERRGRVTHESTPALPLFSAKPKSSGKGGAKRGE